MTSKYKGVSWKQRERKWYSGITFKNVKHHCGSYDSEIEAVKARDKRIIAIGAPKSLLQIIKPISNETKNH